MNKENQSMLSWNGRFIYWDHIMNNMFPQALTTELRPITKS